MSQQTSRHATETVRFDERTVSDRGTAGAVFAATLMIIAGCFGTLQGVGLLAKGTYYVQPANYWINTSASTWGWVLLLAGFVVLVAGCGVLSGAAWATHHDDAHPSSPGSGQLPVHSCAAVVVIHPNSDRPVGDPLATGTSAYDGMTPAAGGRVDAG
jgi:hypothetical protein